MNRLSLSLLSGLCLGVGLISCTPDVQSNETAQTDLNTNLPNPQNPNQVPPGQGNQPNPPQTQRVQVFFPSSAEEMTAVEPVNRTTNREDIANFAIEQLIEGPTAQEQNRGLMDEITPTGESICGGQDFTLNLEDNVAVLQFCRDVVDVGGVGEFARISTALEETLMQFDTVNDVVILDSDGNCFGDMSGENRCLAHLPESNS